MKQGSQFNYVYVLIQTTRLNIILLIHWVLCEDSCANLLRLDANSIFVNNFPLFIQTFCTNERNETIQGTKDPRFLLW